MELKGRTVTVIGLGNSGINAAILANDKGASVRITESNDNETIRAARRSLTGKGIRCQIGGHTKDFIAGSDIIIVSPGVEDSSPSLRWAAELGIPVISEIELGYRFCEGTIIAITGTNGKSTVTTLIGAILKDGGMDTVVCGNMGNSLCGEISYIHKGALVVLEVSSFQLERIETFRPHIAVILNITDDHLDRYTKFDDYFNEKLKIFRYQDKRDFLVLNYDAGELEGLDKKTRSHVFWYSKHHKTNGAYTRNGAIISCAGGVEKKICSINDMRLKGLHNVENFLASVLIGDLVGVEASSMRNTVKNFKGLTHRFETVATIGGVEYIDDSKGTTVDSTYRALESCEHPVILIAGGKDKNSSYAAIKDLVKRKVRHLILIGEAAAKIESVLDGVVEIHKAATMSDAVARAYMLAEANHIVLLSPMCSSFDMFKDYKERGDVFKKAVLELKDSIGKMTQRS